jgi:hypothetical protein
MLAVPASGAFLLGRNSGDTINFLKTNFRKKYQELRQHNRTGRHLESHLRIDKLEVLLGKQLRNKRPDRKAHGKKGGINNFVLCPRNFTEFVLKGFSDFR